MPRRFSLSPTPAEAGVGDLLVAPTRIVLDGRKGAEIILNNIGDEPATYRISVEFRRMTEDGELETSPSRPRRTRPPADMIVYAPRQVTLAPHEPQAIRIAARPPQGLPDGEYRVHMLFRAIPPATPVVQAAGRSSRKGLQFQLTPVYGVTIPVIVRLGNLQATAGIANVQLEKKDGKPAVALDLSRTGYSLDLWRGPRAQGRREGSRSRSRRRSRSIPRSARATSRSRSSAAYKGAARRPVTVQYVETFDDGSHVLAETQAVLR